MLSFFQIKYITWYVCHIFLLHLAPMNNGSQYASASIQQQQMTSPQRRQQPQTLTQAHTPSRSHSVQATTGAKGVVRRNSGGPLHFYLFACVCFGNEVSFLLCLKVSHTIIYFFITIFFTRLRIVIVLVIKLFEVYTRIWWLCYYL